MLCLPVRPLVLLLTMLWGLAGCSTGYAPVTDQSLNRRIASNATHYTVESGDTLYSIAWRHGVDYRRLARINGIGSDYRIYAGQRLRLKGNPKPAPVKRAQRKRSETPAVASRKPVKKPAARASSAIKWRWPAEGRLIGRFSSRGKVNKGINIAGRQGTAVHAAAPGRVVYSGNGLLGYGNLVIINHNRTYLSAYAHNSRVFVKENDTVKTGDKIAEMGSSGAQRVMLHFEIRKDGKPVDPMRYLPNR